MHRAVKQATYFAAATLGLSQALSGVWAGGAPAAPAAAAPAKKDAKAEPKDAPIKPNPALKEKITARIKPWKWGMTSGEVFAELDKQIDQTYAEKVAKAYN